ncbi:uncharacterized protein LOC142322630 [Lycorma delicatula]|uniref:uncharacterized protein LOC142322630 n=1 Tax=Lycorma delicatula TaxID=130591 RepID=UPI003F51655F
MAFYGACPLRSNIVLKDSLFVWFIWETWELSSVDERRLQGAEIRFLTLVAWYTRLDRKRNEDVDGELSIHSLMEMVRDYRGSWLDHTKCMSSTRVSHISEEYSPKGRRSLGRPIKRQRDQFT